ncbi:ABC transporter permease [Roseovarius sp. D0-M9]|uniref:ABC transporter permease n=1 Tax=Roseovarius sp. D0-M9 TaxID=3127117 RepID=UPI00300FDAB7
MPYLRPMILLAPLLLFLSLAYVMPFLGVVGWSVTLPEPGMQNYTTALSDPLILSVFWRTLRICAMVTVISVVMGYILALLWVRGTPLVRTLTELCILIPFWISVLTRAFGWLALLSSRGILNGWLEGMGIIDDPLRLVRNEFGVVVGMVHFMIPFAVFPIASAMRNVDERVLLAARGMGASRTRIFAQAFVPMTAAGIMGASLLVFVFAIGFFITPAILGGGRSVMVAEMIYLRIFQSPDWGLAAAVSVILMVAISALLAVLLKQLSPKGVK